LGPSLPFFIFCCRYRYVIYVYDFFLVRFGEASFLSSSVAHTNTLCCVDGGDGFLFHYYHYYYYYIRMPIDLETYSHELTLSQNGFFFFFTKRHTCARIRSLSPPARTYIPPRPMRRRHHYIIIIMYYILFATDSPCTTAIAAADVGLRSRKL